VKIAITIFQRLLNFFQNQVLYQPVEQPTRFVLDESKQDDHPSGRSPLAFDDLSELERLLRLSRRVVTMMGDTQHYLRGPHNEQEWSCLQKRFNNLKKERAETVPLTLAYHAALGPNKLLVSASLAENELIIGKIFSVDLNKDIVLKKLHLASQREFCALLVFIDGIVDKTIIHQTILKPLVSAQVASQIRLQGLMAKSIQEIIPNSQTALIREFSDIESSINGGDAVLFIEGCEEALVIEVRGGKRRAVSTPQTEGAVRGSQEAFTEVLRVNTALVRSVLRTSDLITEMIVIGKRGRLLCAVMYIQSIANEKLVEEVKRRLRGISIDYLSESGALMQMIVDHPYSWFPQTLSTERPDRVADNLTEGRVAILMEGSPFVNIVPIGFVSLLQSAEDFSLPAFYVTMIRYVRILGAIFTTFLPAIYLALSTFHQEAIPTDLVLAIAASREQVPFPAVFEIMIMLIAFELIREGGVRIPGMLGPTIGIVGAIVLGQAAVSAKIVSPLMIIVVAVSGLASFTIPEYRLGMALRILSFIFLVLGSIFGLVGIAIGFLLTVALLANMKSFGVPYLGPMAPRANLGADLIARGNVENQKQRPDSLNTKDPTRQPPQSRIWSNEEPSGKKK
jgi:spore germination protein KA